MFSKSVFEMSIRGFIFSATPEVQFLHLNEEASFSTFPRNYHQAHGKYKRVFCPQFLGLVQKQPVASLITICSMKHDACFLGTGTPGVGFGQGGSCQTLLKVFQRLQNLADLDTIPCGQQKRKTSAKCQLSAPKPSGLAFSTK